MMKLQKIGALVILPFAVIGLSACATISEDECIAGSWQDIGYKDGRNGNSRGKFADIAKTCAKYNVRPDRAAYMSGYDRGLPLYCTYDKGYRRGEDGSSLNQECVAAGFTAYADGHADGRVFYEIKSEYQGLIDQHENRIEALMDVRRRLKDDELSDQENKRLRKKAYRLENEAEDIRIDIRAMERLYPDLPRHDFVRSN